MMNKRAIYCFAVAFCVMLTSCYDLAELVHGSRPIPVTDITLAKYNTFTFVGGTEYFTAVVLPLNASNKDVEWKSHDESIVDVIDGAVIGRGEGITFITVTSKDDINKKATCTVTVSKDQVTVTGVSLNNPNTILPVNGMEIVTPVITPDNATNQNVTWTSSDEKVATVSQAGVITTKTQGTATVIITSADGGHTTTLGVNVNNNVVAVRGVSLSSSSAILNVGGTQFLSETVTPSDAANKSVLWSSSNPAVATVSQSGFVVGNAEGSATITVTTAEGGKTATCTVSVNAVSNYVSVTGVSLNKTSANILASGTETLTAQVIPFNASNKNVSWTSSNSKIARVSENGLVTGVSDGQAIITAITADGNKTDTCEVNVSAGSVDDTPRAVDFNIIGLGSFFYDGSIRFVFIQAKAGFSTGNITVFYNGNTTAPSAPGTYAITFDVAAAPGWRAVTGLAGGTLVISAVVSPNQTPVASDYDITDLSQVYNGQPKAVSITPKSGKSIGAITIYYNNSTTTPSAVGNYTITFSVAAATGWQAVSGLSGGTLVITSSSIPVTGVTLKPTTSITAGNTETLIASITPSDATNKSVSWESSDTAVATVSGGTVTAVSVGSANITVTTVDGGFNATCAVTVTSIPVTFSSVTANGSSSQTSTQLTLNFNAPISGLTAADIALSGVSGVVKGALTGSNPYTLGISGFTTSGTLSVAVAKDRYNISGTPKTASIYYVAPVITPANLATYLASLSTNTTSTPHNIMMIVTSEDEFSTIRAALNGASNKYVYLDLISGYITSIPDNAFYGTSSSTASKTLTGITFPISVYSIGNSAFRGCSSLTSVNILYGITSIGISAFYDCTSLSSVSISSSVSSIGSGAFEGCSSLASINIPDSVTSIGSSVFWGCTSLSSVSIPNSVTSIGQYAFYNCTSLSSVSITNSVTSIGQYAFYNCASLISVSIPNSVTGIVESAFSNCGRLTNINVSSGNNAYASENGILYNKDKTSLHTYPAGKTETSFIIPNSVTKIGNLAFGGCTSLTNLTIGISVINIGSEAFRSCSSLSSVEFKGTIGLVGMLSFPGDLRAKFYATDSTNGTPGTYITTNPGENAVWTLQP